jgi:hypothetical protein
MEERTHFGGIGCVRLGLRAVGRGAEVRFPAGLQGGEWRAGALQALQFGEGILIRALGQGDAAL